MSRRAPRTAPPVPGPCHRCGSRRTTARRIRWETGCTSTDSAVLEGAGRRRTGEGCCTRSPAPRRRVTGRMSRRHQSQSGRERPIELCLPEPPGDRQAQAVGHPGPPGQPVAQLGQRPRTGCQGAAPGAATRAKRFCPMASASKDRRPGTELIDGDVEVAALEWPDQGAIVAEGGHDGQVARCEPGQDERREELGRRSQTQRHDGGPRAPVVEPAQHRLELVQHRGRLHVQRHGPARRFHAPGGAHEERGPDGPLEPGQLLAGRWLRQPAPAGPVGDRPGPVDGQERPQLLRSGHSFII